MAARIVRNDFVAGEIDPALFGRHDVEMFFHGASKLMNFLPRKTGGVRKRAGTELLWHLSGSEARNYRIVPYRFDKDAYGLLALFRKGTGTEVYWRFWSSADATHPTSEARVKFLSIPAATSLGEINHEQIGDTIYFTLHGFRAWTARVTFSTKSVEWTQLRTTESIKDPPALSVDEVGFSAGTVDATRQYALWGVRNGIRSAVRKKTANIKLKWPAGAYVDVTFTPKWSRHDYYILGKLQGGQYGEVARFYRDSNNGKRSDADSLAVSKAESQTVSGETYTAADDSVATNWRTDASDPDTTNAGGLHTYGTWCRGITFSLANDNAAVLALKLWTGAKMTRASDSSVQQVGLPGSVHAVLRKTDENGPIIAEWDIAPSYQDDPVKLGIDAPKAATTSYNLRFYSDATMSERVYIPMRGFIACTDADERVFHDDNIQPGTLVGEQELLQVGQSGMDVDIITTWQQRLVAASAEGAPFTMWFSALGDLYNFYVDRPQVADNAFEATIASTEANKILHIVSQKWLLAFTESGEYVIDATGGAFAFNTISIKKTSSVGAHPDIDPTTTESDVLFVAADGRSVYKMDYSLERDSVVPSSVSTRAQHITELHRIKKIAYQRYPDSVLWCLLDDGTLATMTFVPEENVCGWARHALAGGGNLVAEDIIATGSIRADSETDTTSEICVVLRDSSRTGDVWVERLRPCVVADKPAKSAAYCKDHMGYAAADYPSGGNPAADVAASLTTMRLEPQQADMIGKQTNAFGAVFRLRRSGAVATRIEGSERWATSSLQPDSVPVEDGAKVQLVRRDVKVQPFALQNRDARIEVRSDDGWPCEILAMLAMMEFGNQKYGG